VEAAPPLKRALAYKKVLLPEEREETDNGYVLRGRKYLE